jgi:hypothetical protein
MCDCGGGEGVGLTTGVLTIYAVSDDVIQRVHLSINLLVAPD